MALYEGIALIQEKQAVVLDIGTDYTKFGFTGEAAPRCIVRSEVWSEARRAPRRLHDYATPEELYDNLVSLLHTLYFRHVLVNPKERKVVVVESLLTPTLFRETLAKVLFIHYEVSAVLWADSPRLCALTLAAPAALVVSLGALDAEVAAVVHGVVVVPALQAAPLGARALHAELARLLREEGGGGEGGGDLPEHVLEDIKVKTCFVTSLARASAWLAAGAGAGGGAGAGAGGGGAETPPLCRAAEVRGVRVGGRARELAAEVMFARDGELAALPDLVLQCIARSPRDARRALARNLVVAGGGAALPGLRARLRDELRAATAREPYRSTLFVSEFAFHAPPAHPACAAWAGGAAAGVGDAARALPRDVYCRERRLRDWVCLLDNTPPDHPHRAL